MRSQTPNPDICGTSLPSDHHGTQFTGIGSEYVSKFYDNKTTDVALLGNEHLGISHDASLSLSLWNTRALSTGDNFNKVQKIKIISELKSQVFVLLEFHGCDEEYDDALRL